MTRALLVFIGGLAGCALDQPEAAAPRRDAIVGGVEAPDDQSVFSLTDGRTSCSAVLIAPRTLLTAGHCVGDGGVLQATNTPNVDAGAMLAILLVERLTAFDGGTDADLALVLLDQPSPVPPTPWIWWGPPPAYGTVIRHVGYGQNAQGESGVRRTVTTMVSAVMATPTRGLVLESGRPGEGICFGDSGGPALVVDHGRERVIAIHSYINATCGSGTSVVLFPHRQHIERWLALHEGESCARDGRCVPACTPVDPDCACATDGVCTRACAPGDDLDCLDVGEGCNQSDLCASGRCLVEPPAGADAGICSEPCDELSPCPSPLFCVAASDGAWCRRTPAPTPGGCDAGLSCRPVAGCADGGPCVDDPLARAPAPPPGPPRQCTTAPSSLGWLLAVAPWFRRRRSA